MNRLKKIGGDRQTAIGGLSFMKPLLVLAAVFDAADNPLKKFAGLPVKFVLSPGAPAIIDGNDSPATNLGGVASVNLRAKAGEAGTFTVKAVLQLDEATEVVATFDSLEVVTGQIIAGTAGNDDLRPAAPTAAPPPQLVYGRRYVLIAYLAPKAAPGQYPSPPQDSPRPPLERSYRPAMLDIAATNAILPIDHLECGETDDIDDQDGHHGGAAFQWGVPFVPTVLDGRVEITLSYPVDPNVEPLKLEYQVVTPTPEQGKRLTNFDVDAGVKTYEDIRLHLEPKDWQPRLPEADPHDASVPVPIPLSVRLLDDRGQSYQETASPSTECHRSPEGKLIVTWTCDGGTLARNPATAGDRSISSPIDQPVYFTPTRPDDVDDSDVNHQVTASVGGWVFDPHPAGPFTFTTTDEFGRSESHCYQEAQFPTAADVTFLFKRQPLLRVWLVVDADHTPLTFGEVTIEHPDGTRSVHRIGPRGMVSLDGARPGTYRIWDVAGVVGWSTVVTKVMR